MTTYIRFYWKTNRTEEDINTLERIDGGYWFSETTTDTQHAFRVLERKQLTQTMFAESLQELSQDFVEIPCWKQQLTTYDNPLLPISGSVSKAAGYFNSSEIVLPRFLFTDS